MILKEKYVGKTIEVYTPFSRLVHRGKVTDVVDDEVICFTIEGTDIETAVYLSDGIKVKIVA
jgi:ferredoxin-fold anticodon binding domain-containing protein